MDFWSFLKKYQSLMKRRGQQAKVGLDLERSLSKVFKLPLNYDKRWRLNFLYKPNKSHVSSYDAFGTLFNRCFILPLFNFLVMNGYFLRKQNKARVY